MIDADLDALDRMITEADALDGDTDLEVDPDLEDFEGDQRFDQHGRLIPLTAFWARIMRTNGWQWCSDFDLDTSAEQWGDPEWIDGAAAGG